MGPILFRYFVRGIVPYFFSAWVLLSVVLFVQQASRFSEILFDIDIPLTLAFQLSIALIPNVISFTAPMALLVGTIIGLARLEEAREITAAMAAGNGPLQIVLPIALFGLVISAFAFSVNSIGLPAAAAMVRSVATQSAIRKLEDPIEPGVVTEMAGLTVYVDEGDIENGIWKRIMIFSDSNPDKRVRLITANSGRLDVSGDRSELVLERALVTTFPAAADSKFAVETAGEVRFGVQTGREALLKRLSEVNLTPEELGIFELSDYAAEKGGSERIEAKLIQQRRILLSAAPVLFSILGTFVALRVRRRGRGVGVLVSLGILVGFYLLTFLGEQLSRTGTVPIYFSIVLPIAGSIAAIFVLCSLPRSTIVGDTAEAVFSGFRARRKSNMPSVFDRILDVSSGIRDFEFSVTLIKHYLTSVIFLTVIFLVFTAFELWKFAGAMEGGIALLLKYLLFMVPYVYLQIAPISAMLAALTTYAVKSGQNEVVAWAGSGVSGYRLIVPGVLVMFGIGIFNLAVADVISPGMNKLQDELRGTLRSKGVKGTAKTRQWYVGASAIYVQSLAISASDNHGAFRPDASKLLSIAKDGFGSDRQHMYQSDGATWSSGRFILSGKVKELKISPGAVIEQEPNGVWLSETRDPSIGEPDNPNHRSLTELRSALEEGSIDSESRSLNIAVEKRISSAVLPLLFGLMAISFGLSLDGKGRAYAVAKAVGFSLIFVLIAGGAEQLGRAGSLPPLMAVWGPIGVFLMLSAIFISRIRT
ncbi:MAG: LptF/LptG family permease [Acidobacteria bacterium]|nr:LptF/LptG family permease [Acidobacteriota bacterium]